MPLLIRGIPKKSAIARALVGAPALLLADEPTGALDSKTGEDVLALFAELHDQGHTIIMITHDRHLAQKADRAVQIIDGHLYAD